jgi:hypothetical protein
MENLKETPLDMSLRGYSSAAMTLLNKNKGSQVDQNERDKKSKVIKNVIKDKIRKNKGKGDNVFDPDPEISEKDTMIKT